MSNKKKLLIEDLARIRINILFGNRKEQYEIIREHADDMRNASRLYLAEYNRLLSTGGDPRNLKLSTFSSNPGRWEAETEGIPPERDGTNDENVLGKY